MKLSKDYIKEFIRASERNHPEGMIEIFFDLCKEIGLKPEPDLTDDQVKAILIAKLFNEPTKGQNGKPI